MVEKAEEQYGTEFNTQQGNDALFYHFQETSA